MKKFIVLMMTVVMCIAFVGCAATKSVDYSSYEGNTYEGTSPWDGTVSVSIDKISDGTMDWSYLEEVPSCGWGYNVQMSSDLSGDKGTFTIEADSGDQKAEYTGTIQLKDGNVVLTFDDGQKTESNVNGGSGYEMVGALDNNQKTVVLEKIK